MGGFRLPFLTVGGVGLFILFLAFFLMQENSKYLLNVGLQQKYLHSEYMMIAELFSFYSDSDCKRQLLSPITAMKLLSNFIFLLLGKQTHSKLADKHLLQGS